MATKITTANLNLIGILLIALGLLVSVAPAGAETMKFGNVGLVAKSEMFEVGDVEGHYIGAYERKGLALHDKGEIAIQFCKGTFDSSGGITSYQGHSILHFEDGSTVSMKYQGKSEPAPGGKTRSSEATLEFTMGTGRFEEIKGKGSFSGMEPRFLRDFIRIRLLRFHWNLYPAFKIILGRVRRF